MKLRKALEKAKQERHEKILSVPTEAQLIEGTGWKPPVYSESRPVEIDSVQMCDNRCICAYPSAPEVDDYKMLRTQILRRTREKGWRTIMITSAHPGEGKTLTAINLSITFAKEHNQTVLLVDGDLSLQKIHHYMGFSSEVGLLDYFREGRSLKELINWPDIEKLTVISGGEGIVDTAELLGSPRMNELVDEMKDRYDDRYVIFDVPPILNRADAMAFAPFVDCLVVVVKAGRTTFLDIKEVLELIPKEKFLGFILNRGKLRAMKEGYARSG
ncbi:MAG: AAA family ATPase [Promethearchaeota archaeon]|jgi:non-specific protein-tyrosine kinase